MFRPVVCTNCGGSNIETGACATVVFKVTGSGKAVVDKGSYKTVEKLKIKKGALALEGSACANEASNWKEFCCYDGGYFYATIKAGKKTFAIAAPITVGVWSVFGKNLEKARNYLSMIKKGKSVCLDSALFVYAEETEWAGDVDLEEFAFWASAFGKMDMKVTNEKGDTKYCDRENYTGWFVGTYPCVNMEDCFMCECPDTDVFGGTWKAVYQKKIRTFAGAMSLAGVSISDDDED